LELLACKSSYQRSRPAADEKSVYLVSLCSVCVRQNLQYFLNSSLSGVVRLFLVVV